MTYLFVSASTSLKQGSVKLNYGSRVFTNIRILVTGIIFVTFTCIIQKKNPADKTLRLQHLAKNCYFIKKQFINSYFSKYDLCNSEFGFCVNMVVDIFLIIADYYTAV